MDDGRLLPEADRLADLDIEQPPTPRDPVALLAKIREHHKILMQKFPQSRGYDEHALHVQALTEVISILLGRAHVFTVGQAIAFVMETRLRYARSMVERDAEAPESQRYYAEHVDGLNRTIKLLRELTPSRGTNGNNDTKVDAAS